MMHFLRTLLLSSAVLAAQLATAGAALGADTGLDDFLPVEKAFQLTLQTAADGAGLRAEFTPAPTYYLYRNRLSFVRSDGAKAVPLSPKLPSGEKKSDPNFGEVEVYHKSFEVIVPFAATVNAPDDTLTVGYQGCSEKGLCYPPVERAYHITHPASGASWTITEFHPPEANADVLAAAALTTASSPSSAAKASALAPPESENSRIASVLGSGNAFVIIAAFFGFGLLLALTPCVFPMIPILSGIIVGDGKAPTRSRGLLLSGAYVLGMAITYSLAGVAAGLSGSLLQNALQNIWVLGAFALVFVVLACSMFGLFQIQLPGVLQNRISSASNGITGGRVTGVFFMGALSALIVGPCVAAPLAGALLYISQTRNVVLGGVALFSMAIGMGMPLLLIGASAGALLPRAGAWMETVKRIFGVLLLATAIWLISPVIDALPLMLMSAALLLGSAVFLHALDPLPPTANGIVRLGKSIGILFLIAGAALVIGVLSGSKNLLQPLDRLAAGGSVSMSADAAAQPTFTRVSSTEELDDQVRRASGKPVMLDFYADWCVSCKEMEHLTFADPAVHALLGKIVLLQMDVTANNAQDKAMLKRFGLFGPPGILFFDHLGKELPVARVIGYQQPDRFVQSLRSASSLY